MRVLVTGVAGGVGRLVAEHLLADPAIDTVIGLDARACRPPVPGLRFVRAALRQPDWTPLLEGVSAVVHLEGIAWPPRRAHRQADATLVDNLKYLLRAMQAAGVPRLVAAHSAALYGAQPPGRVLESAPVHGHSAGRYARARALAADYLEAVTNAPGSPAITRLRVAWVCGPRHLTLARYLAHNPVLVCGREDRRLQVVHEDDLAEALRLALHDDLTGVYHVGADDGLSLREVATLVGRERACVPLLWVTLRAWWAWRWAGRRTPPAWARLLYSSAPLDTSRLRAAGWMPRYSTRQALTAALSALDTGA